MEKIQEKVRSENEALLTNQNYYARQRSRLRLTTATSLTAARERILLKLKGLIWAAAARDGGR